MNRLLKYLFSLFILSFLSLPLFASTINLNNEKIYIRKGFNQQWITRIPDPSDNSWYVVPGSKTGDRKVVINELPFDGMPKRHMFSLKEIPPENFTFIIAFHLDERDLSLNSLKGIFFANIGENWSVFLNGRLLKSEIHLNCLGEITGYRHWREVLIPIDPRHFNKGTNILAVRIIGDPTNIDSGFHRSNPFIIDDLEKLEKKRSEQTAIILIFLYFFFGIYHIFIFLKRTKEKYNLYYGAFSFFLFIYLLSRSHTIYALIPDSTLLHRIEYSSLYILFPLFGAFADLLLTGKYSRLTKISAAFYGLLILITVAPVSNVFAIDILRIWQISAIVPIIYYTFFRIGYSAYIYFKRVYRNLKSYSFPFRIFKSLGRALSSSMAGNLLLGAIIMATCAVYDILDSMFWAYDYVLTQYGFFIFTMGITLILANRFISIHKNLEAHNMMTQNEMELASQVQKSLLPDVPEAIDGWDIALAFRPLHEVSGDFYDFYYKDNQLRGISIFDVSGHGVSSALVTLIVKPITHDLFREMDGESLTDILEQVNQKVSLEIIRLDHFISCILLRLSGSTVEYINAGHPDLLHRIRRNGDVRAVVLNDQRFRGEPLGFNISNAIPRVITFGVEKGDIILLFTDCIIEGINSRKERYGIDRLMSSLQEAPVGSAEETLDFILKRFLSYIDKKKIRDDFTVILAKRTL